jgi:hypothetical protein
MGDVRHAIPVPDLWSLLAAIAGTSALAFAAVLLTRQRGHALTDHAVPAAADTERALWALTQLEDKLTAALEWVPLGQRALSSLKLRRGMRNVVESLGPVGNAPWSRDGVERLHAHVEDFLANTGIDPAAQRGAARDAIEDIKTLRRALESHAADPLCAPG